MGSGVRNSRRVAHAFQGEERHLLERASRNVMEEPRDRQRCNGLWRVGICKEHFSDRHDHDLVDHLPLPRRGSLSEPDLFWPGRPCDAGRPGWRRHWPAECAGGWLFGGACCRRGSVGTGCPRARAGDGRRLGEDDRRGRTDHRGRCSSSEAVSAERGTGAPTPGAVRYGDDRTTQHHRTTSTTHNSTHPRELAAAS